MADGGEDADDGVAEHPTGIDILLRIAPVVDSVACKALQVVQRSYRSFPAETIQGPKKQYIELAFRCSREHRLKLVTVTTTASDLVRELRDNRPSLLRSKLPQLD